MSSLIDYITRHKRLEMFRARWKPEINTKFWFEKVQGKFFVGVG